MKNDSGMLELLAATDRDLAIYGADDVNDGKSGDDKDKDADKNADKSKEQDSDKDKDKQDSITLTGSDLRTWNNLQEERDRIHKKVKDAETERDEAIKARDTAIAESSDEDSKKQLTALTTERDALAETNADLQMQLAFLRTPGYDWVDPDAALKLADLSNVDTDKKGKVIASSMKVELDRLAKEKPYLLKKVDKDDDNDDDQDKDKPKKTGDPAPQKRQQSSKDQAARDAELARKYPALRR